MGGRTHGGRGDTGRFRPRDRPGPGVRHRRPLGGRRAERGHRLPRAGHRRAPGRARRRPDRRHRPRCRHRRDPGGDSLRDDAFPGLAADIVLCNPPFATRDWGHDEVAFDDRWVYGLPPKSESELAWVQHCLAHLKPGGRAVLLMPPGAAERPTGRDIRTALARDGAVRAIVAFAAGTAPPFNIGLHMWVLQRPDGERPEETPVLFVDTANFREDLQGDALRETITALWSTYLRAPKSFEAVPGTARTVPVLDLLNAATDLNPARHVRTAAPMSTPVQYAAALNKRRGRLRHAADALLSFAGTEDWRPVGAEPVTWRTASVADLLRGNALDLQRGPSTSRATSRRGARGGGPAPVIRPDARVFTARDVTSGGPATGLPAEHELATPFVVQADDILVPEVVRSRITPRVADDQDAGHLLGPHLILFRPDPERLDPWFLAGFLATEGNMRNATAGSSIVRIDASRLRVPLLPMDVQRRYGRAFRRVYALRRAAHLTGRLAELTARELDVGLSGGVLEPPASSAVTARPRPRSTTIEPHTPKPERTTLDTGKHAELTNRAWSVADLLRGNYKQSDYGKVILPFTVLRRLECVLEPTREKVHQVYELRKNQDLELDRFLRRAAEHRFYNTSDYTLEKIASDPSQTAKHLLAYIGAFSPTPAKSWRSTSSPSRSSGWRARTSSTR
ncbi:N-6 DNA methylase [Actinomadura sp. CNU-125]|uniref:N-6 DNA methylase n=1 Tax=Actinomadura sp. CNU-125 TaxID=1904961 RepID=UPI0029168B75|nr:N-6 DNA methylase [Actinomadura sp. CNU-125]